MAASSGGRVPSFSDLTHRKLFLVSVLPDISGKQSVRTEIESSCDAANTDLEEISFASLDQGETRALDVFYYADVVVVDVSVYAQQATLVYQLAVRESLGLCNNIVIFNVNNVDTDRTYNLMVSQKQTKLVVSFGFISMPPPQVCSLFVSCCL